MVGGRRRRAAGGALVLAGLVGGLLVASPTAQAEDAGARVAGRATYVVVLEPRAGAASRSRALEVLEDAGADVTAEYTAAVDGFAATMSAATAEDLREAPGVAVVERDRVFRVNGTQQNPPWGLDRIDQRGKALNQRYTYGSAGAGVTAYIVDTGIKRTHKQFGARVKAGFSVIRDGRGTGDCNGHGTHVAGTVGGSAAGVAKQVQLRPVRVLNCRGSGTTSGIIDALDWIARHHGTGPAVANLSLGGGASNALDAAVQGVVDDGVTMVVAAGNEFDDACYYSPARASDAITVGATNRSDGKPGFSNWGTCLDLFAPGVDIRSTGIRSNTAWATMSGTSMASPHVAGVVATFLGANPSADPATVADALLGSATAGTVTGRGAGSPNLLLFSAPAVPPELGPNLLANPGFESGATAWTSSSGVISTGSARSGSWKAHLLGFDDGTDWLQQTVTVPSASTARLTFHLWVDSDEDSSTPYDTLVVRANGTQVASFSNGHHGTGYVKRTADLTPWAGQEVTLRFDAFADGSLITSFLVDDVAVQVG